MIGTDLSEAARLLHAGELVAIPTETVYGLAANALNPRAVSKIFAAKERPSFNPLIVHLGTQANPEDYCTHFSDHAKLLADKFWPGPLSILVHKNAIIPDIVSSGLDSVVLRMPSHPLAQELLQQLPFPLAAPSANLYQQISPTTAEHVAAALGHKVPYILDGGPSTIGVESTIIDCRAEKPVLLRHGGIAKEDIEELIGPISESIKQNDNPSAPGQMDQHYSTKKPLYYTDDVKASIAHWEGKKISLILWGDKHFSHVAHHYHLSKDGSFLEAASNLFLMMHLADQDDSELIIASKIPEIGLGKAINDRLIRASS